MTYEQLIQQRDAANEAADRAYRHPLNETHEEFMVRIAYQRGRAAAFDQAANMGDNRREDRDSYKWLFYQMTKAFDDAEAEHQRVLEALQRIALSTYTVGNDDAIPGPSDDLVKQASIWHNIARAALSTPPEDTKIIPEGEGTMGVTLRSQDVR